MERRFRGTRWCKTAQQARSVSAAPRRANGSSAASIAPIDCSETGCRERRLCMRERSSKPAYNLQLIGRRRDQCSEQYHAPQR